MHNKDKNSQSGLYAGQPVGSLHTFHFINCPINVMTVFWSFIRQSSVCTCWKKGRPFFLFLVIYHKWLMKCIFVENMFLSWQHFLDASPLIKILEGTLVIAQLVHNQRWEEQYTLTMPNHNFIHSLSYRDLAVGEKWRHSNIRFWGKWLTETNNKSDGGAQQRIKHVNYFDQDFECFSQNI